ncbi:MAG: hypothetical protein WAM72_11670, partial [Xanthobacteraceae bacterium]
MRLLLLRRTRRHTVSATLASLSDLSAQTLHKRMVRSIDNPVAERDLQDFREWYVRPYRLGQIPGRFEHLIG